MDQSFTANNFLKITKKSDPRKYKLGRNYKDYIKSHRKSIRLLKDKNFKIDEVLKVKAPHGDIVHIDKKHPHAIFAVRKANQNIKNLYNVKPSNREKIVRQVISLIEVDEPKVILRLDISRFYESIPSGEVISRILTDYRINHETKNIIESLYRDKAGAGYSCLHRGLSLSATISEIYMQNIDKKFLM